MSEENNIIKCDTKRTELCEILLKDRCLKPNIYSNYMRIFKNLSKYSSIVSSGADKGGMIAKLAKSVYMDKTVELQGRYVYVSGFGK